MECLFSFCIGVCIGRLFTSSVGQVFMLPWRRRLKSQVMTCRLHLSKLEQAICCKILLRTPDKRLPRLPPAQPGADPNREGRGCSPATEKEKNVFVCVVGVLAEAGEKENTRGCNINSQPFHIYKKKNPCAALSAWHHSCVYRFRTEIL